MEESRGAKAANDSHFSRRRRWRLEYLAGNGCVVFPRLLGWVSTIVNGPTQHRRGRLDTAFSYEKAYETILTLNLAKQALSPHNFWNANKPGTTLFIPMVDLTQQMLDLLAIYAGTGFVPFDPVHDSLCGDLDRFIESGLLDGNKRFSIVDFEHYALATGTMEIALVCYNLVLTMQAMGLGGWMFTGINPPSLMGAFAKDGISGLGFRFTPRPPGTQSNPVGVDNYFEGLCPPYYYDMREAVDKFVDMKFGRGGTYDPQRPGPFRDNASVKADIQRYTPEFVECLGEIAQYMHDAFGKFPATIPSTYARVYAQAQHIDMDFYDRFYGPESYLDSHRDHMARWHGDQEGS